MAPLSLTKADGGFIVQMRRFLLEQAGMGRADVCLDRSQERFAGHGPEQLAAYAT